MELRVEQAEDTQEAVAKLLYGAVFDWLVEVINGTTAAPEAETEAGGGFIGVLDIFGFESFAVSIGSKGPRALWWWWWSSGQCY